jgi:hypothetical protein
VCTRANSWASNGRRWSLRPISGSSSSRWWLAFREPQEGDADIQALLRVIAEDPRYREGGVAGMIILVKHAITVAGVHRDFPLSYRKVRERIVTEVIEAYYSRR